MTRRSLTLLCALLLPSSAWAQPADRPAPLPKDIVAAWRNAGLEAGWQRKGDAGQVEYLVDGQEQAGDRPAFQLFAGNYFALATLPAPAAPFGLFSDGTNRHMEIAPPVFAAQLKELARFENLQTLNLGHMPVTAAGLKELAGLKKLQSVSIHNNYVRDAELQELAGFDKLHTLDLSETRVTDDGLKVLAGLPTTTAIRDVEGSHHRGTEITEQNKAECLDLELRNSTPATTWANGKHDFVADRCATN